jgi:hypothetical protein
MDYLYKNVTISIIQQDDTFFKFLCVISTLSSGCLMAMRYLHQLTEDGRVEVTRTGIREKR